MGHLKVGIPELARYIVKLNITTKLCMNHDSNLYMIKSPIKKTFVISTWFITYVEIPVYIVRIRLCYIRTLLGSYSIC